MTRSMTPEEAQLMDAYSALKWAAGGEFSARVTPPQARALLAEKEAMKEAWNTLVEKYAALQDRMAMVIASYEGGPRDGIGAPPDFGRSSA